MGSDLDHIVKDKVKIEFLDHGHGKELRPKATIQSSFGIKPPSGTIVSPPNDGLFTQQRTPTPKQPSNGAKYRVSFFKISSPCKKKSVF